MATVCKFACFGLSLIFNFKKKMTSDRLPVIFRYRFLWHLLFWAGVFSIYWLNGAGITGSYYHEFILGLALLPARILGTYSFIYLILPLAIEKKKFILFGILVMVHFFIYGFLIYLSYYLINPYPEIYDFTQHSLLNPGKFATKAVSDYVVPAMAAAILIFKKWYLDQLKSKKLTEEKIAAELNFLKSQVHPHFLFNTLNNLYALTLIKSDKASDIVLKLSDLMDYMIYKSNDTFVPLAKELEIINGYIELEKMRYNQRLDLQYEIKGETGIHQIAPLILLPFVENCFKHGSSKDRIKPTIHINVDIEPDFLLLKAVNSIPPEKKNGLSDNKGIGLKNVKRRLELIYPKKHELKIIQGDKLFRVECKIFWK